MKVIGAGFGRTGTTSLKAALEILTQGRCHHMEVVLQEDGRLDPWHALAVGEEMDWRAAMADFEASVDFPSCIYYAELMEAFPEAKVVLSVRDPDDWFKSWKGLMGMVMPLRRMRFLIPKVRRTFEFFDNIIMDPVFSGRPLDKATAVAAFERHNARVREAVPSERLLVYNVKEGWEPLCRFLDVPVPDAPFPHLNAGTGGVRQILARAFGVSFED